MTTGQGWGKVPLLNALATGSEASWGLWCLLGGGSEERLRVQTGRRQQFSQDHRWRWLDLHQAPAQPPSLIWPGPAPAGPRMSATWVGRDLRGMALQAERGNEPYLGRMGDVQCLLPSPHPQTSHRPSLPSDCSALLHNPGDQGRPGPLQIPPRLQGRGLATLTHVGLQAPRPSCPGLCLSFLAAHHFCGRGELGAWQISAVDLGESPSQDTQDAGALRLLY